ncbi:MAG TPA: FAD-dependent oxidoreductase [Propionibacteriaceae bacterium]
MDAPVILAVDEDPNALRNIEQELNDRYARHYRVRAMPSAMHARQWLEELSTAGDEVALILAGQSLSEMTGSELLNEAHHLHPHAKRALLVEWSALGDRATGKAIFDSIAHGRIDHYLLKPSPPPDELFHNTISGLLLEWAEAQRAFPFTIRVVGESWSGRAYELRKALNRCAYPHAFWLADSSRGRAVVKAVGENAKLPLMLLPDGRVLENPTNAEIALASGSPVAPDREDYDLVIVGAGPAGLSAAVYGASEGFNTLVVDDGGIGGQATSSSLIRNYLGFPRGVSGRRLAQRAYEQAWVFGASFAFMQQVADLRREDDWLALTLSDFGAVHARAVVLASGVSYRRLGIPALEELNGAGVFYGGPTSEAPAMAGRDVYILGGANSAGQAALYLARYAAHVTVVVRADSLAAGMSHYLIREIEETPNVSVRLGAEIVGGGGDAWLDHLVLAEQGSGSEETVAAGGLFLMIGAHPRIEWLPSDVDRDDQGFILTGTDLPASRTWPLQRHPFLLETSMPAVFAAGDVRYGSGKRVASAVGEGAVAIQLRHRLFASEPQYPPDSSPERLAIIGL